MPLLGTFIGGEVGKNFQNRHQSSASAIKEFGPCRFHKMSINEYQQSMTGFSGKIVNLRTLKVGLPIDRKKNESV